MLADDDLERWSRQVVVPGVGARGQALLCSTRIVVRGDPIGIACVEAYARAAGFRTSVDEERPIACALVAGASALDRESLVALAALRCPVLWYDLSPEGIRAGLIPCEGSVDGSERAHSFPGLDTDAPPDPLLHHLAAADLVASAVALVLGWTDAETSYRVKIA